MITAQSLTSVKKYIVLYDFNVQQEGDLSFKKGETIYFTMMDGDWYEGETKDVNYAILPPNYVKKKN